MIFVGKISRMCYLTSMTQDKAEGIVSAEVYNIPSILHGKPDKSYSTGCSNCPQPVNVLGHNKAEDSHILWWTINSFLPKNI